MITKCARNYYKYPASMKPNLNSKDLVRFPKGFVVKLKNFKQFSVTICMNGMHSTRKIKERYPGYLPIIRELYTGFFNERYLSCHKMHTVCSIRYAAYHMIWIVLQKNSTQFNCEKDVERCSIRPVHEWYFKRFYNSWMPIYEDCTIEMDFIFMRF